MSDIELVNSIKSFLKDADNGFSLMEDLGGFQWYECRSCKSEAQVGNFPQIHKNDCEFNKSIQYFQKFINNLNSYNDQYKDIKELISLIDSPNREKCLKLLQDNISLFSKAYGSIHNHQSWLGGYLHHIEEIMNIAIVLYNPLNNKRKLPFTLSSVLLVLFIHDLEKPWKYEFSLDGKLQHKSEFACKADDKIFRETKIIEYGIELSEEERNAFYYVEGEMSDYSSRKRVMNPLAAFCHLCDVTSARIWFDCPKDKDTWKI